MKKAYIYFCIILLFCNYSFAETNQKLRAKFILENMQQEYTECYVFYKIGAESVRQSNKNNEMSAKIEKSADIALKLAFETGELLGLNTEIMQNKVETEVKFQLDEIKDDFLNYKKLLQKYANLCKNLLEDKESRINFWEEKALNKYK